MTMSTSISYKGCTISRTNTSTSVLRSYFGSLSTHEVYVPLYEIEGAVNKPRGLRPFITSIAEAKDYISEALDAAPEIDALDDFNWVGSRHHY
jgi:hypothetical protein